MCNKEPGLKGMIAPCGINCGVCIAYLGENNKCTGCRTQDSTKRKYCQVCKIKNCKYLLDTDTKFCYECSMFPCKRLKQLDKRYSTKYNTPIIENLKIIRDSGLEKFVADEIIKWKCNKCGGSICVHKNYCLRCHKNKN